MTHLDLDPRVPLGEPARLLSVAHRPLLNHVHVGTLQQLLPGTTKVLGRWRVPVSAIQGLLAVEERPKPEPLIGQILRSVDHPHLKKANHGPIRDRDGPRRDRQTAGPRSRLEGSRATGSGADRDPGVVAAEWRRGHGHVDQGSA